MVSGPQMAQIIAEFEMSAGSEQRTDADSRHHEENRHTQKSFAEDVKALVSTIEDMGNPFLESTSDLLWKWKWNQVSLGWLPRGTVI